MFIAAVVQVHDLWPLCMIWHFSLYWPSCLSDDNLCICNLYIVAPETYFLAKLDFDIFNVTERTTCSKYLKVTNFCRY